MGGAPGLREEVRVGDGAFVKVAVLEGEAVLVLESSVAAAAVTATVPPDICTLESDVKYSTKQGPRGAVLLVVVMSNDRPSH